MKRSLRACVVTALAMSACAGSHEPRRVPRSQDDLPVVLAHGLSGFRTLSGIDYFWRVPGALRERGHDVYVTHVPPWGPVPTRAVHLGEQIDAILKRTHARAVHVVAHSMGGLDARWAISRLGYHDRIASLTTVGTPHRGTPLADGYTAINWAPTHPLQDFSADFFIWTLGGIRVHSDTAGAVVSLSERFAAEFNAAAPDHPNVRYYSFAGRTLGHDGKGYCEDAILPPVDEVDVVAPPLLSTAVFLSGLDPAHPVANDGLVTVPSARWGLFMGCIPADHMEEVGQPAVVKLPGQWNHRDFYLDWVDQLVSGRARSYAQPGSPGAP